MKNEHIVTVKKLATYVTGMREIELERTDKQRKRSTTISIGQNDN